MKKAIAFLILLSGVCFGQITRIDSISDWTASVYLGGDVVDIGRNTNLKAMIYASSTTGHLIEIVTFECSDVGILPATVIDIQPLVIGSGTVGWYPDIIWIPDTQYFIASFSMDVTVDSTILVIIEIDTTNGMITDNMMDREAIKWNCYLRSINLVQVANSNYFVIDGSGTNRLIKTFLIDPEIPVFTDLTVDSVITSNHFDTNLCRVGQTNFYLETWCYTGFYSTTYMIDPADGNITWIGDITLRGSATSGYRFDCEALNNSIFIATTVGASPYPYYLQTIKVNNTTGAIDTVSSTQVVSAASMHVYDYRCRFSVIISDDVVATVFTGADYDGWYAIYRINPTGIFTETIQSATEWCAVDATYLDILNLASDYILITYNQAGTHADFLTWQLNVVSENWPHSRCGVSSTDILEISGTAIEDIEEVSGVEK